jgi:phosphate transport system ATP-binding protein
VSDQCAFFLAEENQPGILVEKGTTDHMFNHPVDERTLSYVEGRFG